MWRTMCMAIAFMMAAVVANQCPRSHNEPQNVVSLLQSQLQVNVPDVGSEEKEPSCPVEIDTLAVDSLHSDKGNMTRVMMADYPDTGSTWLIQLLGAVAAEEKVGNPACSIYEEDMKFANGSCEPSSQVHCPLHGFYPGLPGFTHDLDVALIKSHYPALELWHGDSLHGWQYDASMKYDRILQLVRHPVATVDSNVHRVSLATHSHQSESLHCWGTWWERVKEKAGDANVLVVRYEDLCLNTTAELHQVLQFLGGRFAKISRASVKAVLAKRLELECRRKEQDLYAEMQMNHKTEFIVQDNKDLMARWGYRTDGSSEWNGP